MESIEGSETSAFKPQTPGKYPKESMATIRLYNSSILPIDIESWKGQGAYKLGYVHLGDIALGYHRNEAGNKVSAENGNIKFC